MNLLMIIRVAFRALVRNKLRAALTMLGIIIGVSAVIAMVSIGQGAQASVQAQIESIGTNLLFVSAGAQNLGGVRSGTGDSGTNTLTVEDLDAVAVLERHDPLDAGEDVADVGRAVGPGDLDRDEVRVRGDADVVQELRVVLVQRAAVAGEDPGRVRAVAVSVEGGSRPVDLVASFWHLAREEAFGFALAAAALISSTMWIALYRLLLAGSCSASHRRSAASTTVAAR